MEMQFEQYGDGKWRWITPQGMYSSSFEPDADTEWVEADVLTSDGKPVFIPKAKRKVIKVDKLKVHKKVDKEDQEDVEIEFV